MQAQEDYKDRSKKRSLFSRSGGPLPKSAASGGVLNPALNVFGLLIYSPLYGISFFGIGAFNTTA